MVILTGNVKQNENIGIKQYLLQEKKNNYSYQHQNGKIEEYAHNGNIAQQQKLLDGYDEYLLRKKWASLLAQLLKNAPSMQETWVQSWVRKISWRRERLPIPVFWPGEFHGLYARNISTSVLLTKSKKPLTVWITTNWKILKQMGIPHQLTCLLGNLYAAQEATVRTGHGAMSWVPNWERSTSRLYILTLLI